MALTAFQALDRAVEAGGTDLKVKDIVGAEKKDRSVLDELLSDELLSEKGRGNAKTYSVTEEGRAFWERRATPERKREIEEREVRQHREAILDFLRLVQRKVGKVFTPTEQRRLAPEVREEALDQKLVKKGPRTNTYELLPAGEEQLLAALPVPEQLEQLQKLQHETGKRWQGAHRRLLEELEELGEEARKLHELATELGGKGKSAAATFETALRGLGAFAELATAARGFKEAVEEVAKAAAERVEAEAARIKEADENWRKTLDEAAEDVRQRTERVGKHLEALARRSAVEPAEEPAPTPTKSPDRHPPPEAAVWDATQTAYQELERQAVGLGGSVTIPELTDAVRRLLPALVPGPFHELLRKWQREDRVILRVCNDRSLEPRAAEGIDTPRGLLFYVQVRP